MTNYLGISYLSREMSAASVTLATGNGQLTLQRSLPRGHKGTGAGGHGEPGPSWVLGGCLPGLLLPPTSRPSLACLISAAAIAVGKSGSGLGATGVGWGGVGEEGWEAARCRGEGRTGEQGCRSKGAR